MNIETQLRWEFSQVAESVEPAASNWVGAEPRRSSRVRGILLPVASAVAACAVVGTVVLVRGALTNEASSVPSATGQSSPIDVTSLPQGAPTTLGYIDGVTLHTGDQEIALPGDDAGIQGALPDGWLVIVERGDASTLSSEYVLVSSRGDLSPLPAPSRSGYGAAVSPDGASLVYGGTILDAESLRELGALPQGSAQVAGWNQFGIYVGQANGTDVVADDGSMVTSLDAGVSAVAGDSKRVLINGRDNCVTVVEQSGQPMTELLTGCGPEAPQSISPNGEWVLTRDLTLRSVEGGQAFELGIAPSSAFAWAAGWEGDSSVVLSVSLNDEGTQQQLVRCAVSTGSCELAGTPVRSKDNYPFDLSSSF